MIKRFTLALGAVLLLGMGAAQAQGISQKVAVCNWSYASRCIAVDASGNVPVTGSLTPSGTQDVNITQVGGNAVTTTVPVSDGGGSLTVDTLQLPPTLGVKTAANSLSIAPASDSTFPATQSGTWNITNISGTVSLPTGAATAANQTTANTSLSSIDTKLTSPLSVAQSGTWTNAVTQSTAANLNATVVGAGTSGAASGGVLSVQGPVAAGATTGFANPNAIAGYTTVTAGVGSGALNAIQVSTSGNLGVVAQGNTASANTDVGNPVKIGGIFLTSPTAVSNGQRVDGRFSSTGALHTVPDPTSDAASGITPTVTSAAASNLVAKASAGNLYGFQVTSGASAGYVLLFNATSLPADGAVTPIKCYSLAATSTLSVDFRPGPPVRFGAGLTIGFSTTGCFTLTASATAFISSETQ